MFHYYTFSVPIQKKWVENLIVEYQKYLENYHTSQRAVREHLHEASKVFLAMDEQFILPIELTLEWLNEIFDIKALTKGKRSLTTFLSEKKLIRLPDEEQKYLVLFEKITNNCKVSFKKVIVLYYTEKLNARRKQVEVNARNPIAFKTIEGHIGILVRMVRWINSNYENVNSWIDVKEEYISSFLLSLKPNNRECVRKDLYAFFKFAKRKRCIFNIPIVDYKSRELPRVNYVLTFKEQSELAHKIVNEFINQPYEALLTVLAFYHAVQSRYIAVIKLADIDIDNRKIIFKEIPDIYLMNVEFAILQEYMKLRKSFPNCDEKNLLFIRRKRSGIYGDIPIDKTFICKRVKEFSGSNPQTLRITCLTTMANYNGPQFLREAYGISQTHAGRFGNYEDYLIEEALEQMLE